jgi:predicted GIY-YIG superfamily endonuclease
MPPYNKRQKTNNSSLNPIRLQTSLCAVECEDEDGFEFCYIQPSQDLSRDLMHHLQGSGSPYTQTYKPTGKVGIKLFVTDVEAESKALAEEYKAKDFSVFSELEQTDAYIAQCMRMRLAPVDLLVQTYVLECEPLANCNYTGRYIGNTQNLSLRIPHHFNRTGANWTKLHKPIGVFEVICDRTFSTRSI